MTTLTPAQHADLMQVLDLDSGGESLVETVRSTSGPKATTQSEGPRYAPDGVDTHTMPVGDIEFSDDMVDDFPVLSGDGFASASRHLWAIYKSPRGQTERNQLLHRRITEFLHQVNRHRKTGGLMRERVRADAPARELAGLLQAHNLTVEDLAALLLAKGVTP
jgi:hypothetical protein